MDCIKCNHPVPQDGRFLTCFSCQNVYHLRKQCSGVAESTFAGMGASRRENWRCPTCRTGELRSGSSVAGNVSMDDLGRTELNERERAADSTVAGQLASINAALGQLLTLKTSVDSLLPLSAKVDQLLDLKPAVDELRTTVCELQASVDSFKSKYDTVLALANANDASVRDLQHEVSAIKAVTEDQTREISRLKEELNDSQQYSRRANMELHGLPSVPGENLLEVMRDLSQKIDLPTFQSTDILTIHRLPKKRDGAPIVLITFASVTLKDAWMAARGRLKNLCQANNDPKLFFNDNLTQANRELFWLTRTRGKESNFRFVWLKNAKIFAKKEEGSPVIRINSVRDLTKLV